MILSTKIKIDTSALNKVVEGLGEFQKEMPGAAISAVNRTLNHVNTKIGKIVTSEYRVKVSDIKVTITKHKARKGSLKAYLQSNGRRLTLGRFRYGRARKAVKVKVKNSESAKKVKTSPKVFIQNLNGRDQVMKRVGRKRYPVEVLRTVSIPQMIDSMNVSEKIQEIADTKLRERIDHEIDYRLRKLCAR